MKSFLYGFAAGVLEQCGSTKARNALIRRADHHGRCMNGFDSAYEWNLIRRVL